MLGLIVRVTKFCLFLLLGCYVFIPVFIRTFPWIQTSIVFQTMVNARSPDDLHRPDMLGLKGARNFYINGSDSIILGAWHIPPHSLVSSDSKVKKYLSHEDTFSDGKLIILYLHGSTGTRANPHRVGLYKVLAASDYHVVALDYRGFGDSTGTPSEDGVCEDSYVMYQWLKQRRHRAQILIWGHSLGTGITTKLTKALCDEGDPPAAIVLESPFTNIREVAARHPFTLPYRYMPGFSWVFLDTLQDVGIFFANDKSIVSVTPPLLILHAEDDHIVPIDLGKKLYQISVEARADKSDSVLFVPFNASLGYAHKHIWRAPELPGIVGTFVASALAIGSAN